MPRVGRRPGNVDTRAEIVDAARACFATHGFNGTSIRHVAQQAGVDPALVHHYFADKGELFVAAMGMAGDPRKVAEAAADGWGVSGEALVERFLAQWELDEGSTESPTFVAMVQALSASVEAAESMRDFLIARLGEFHPGEGELSAQRQALVSSQLVGLGWTRYVMRFEPVASADRAEVARWVGPTIDRYLAAGADAPPAAGR